MSVCKFCSQFISWKEENGSPLPYNPDGTRHDCRSRKVDQPVKTPPQQSPDLAILGSPQLENKVRVIVREEIERLFKRYLAP